VAQWRPAIKAEDMRPKPLTAPERQALGYVINTGGNATIAIFDEDHEPIGPMLRERLMPGLIAVGEDGKLTVTQSGHAALLEPDILDLDSNWIPA
jgi:hypothetical protein